jgi:hypothetical protein
MLLILLRFRLKVFPTGLVICLYLVESPLLVLPNLFVSFTTGLCMGEILRAMLTEGIFWRNRLRAPELLLGFAIMLEPVTICLPARELISTRLLTG